MKPITSGATVLLVACGSFLRFDGKWHGSLDRNGSLASGRSNQSISSSFSGEHSWWYGQDSTGNYETGSANSGDLTSTPILIPSAGQYLRFMYLYESETYGPDWDQRWVQISVDGVLSRIFCSFTMTTRACGWAVRRSIYRVTRVTAFKYDFGSTR